MNASGSTAFQVNNVWNGSGTRNCLKKMRAIIDAVLDGAIDKSPTTVIPVFSLKIPATLPGVNPKILDPRNSWPNPAQWETKARDLAGHFIRNFRKYEEEDHELAKAGHSYSL